jgi:hypothetical protein
MRKKLPIWFVEQIQFLRKLKMPLPPW